MLFAFQWLFRGVNSRDLASWPHRCASGDCLLLLLLRQRTKGSTSTTPSILSLGRVGAPPHAFALALVIIAPCVVIGRGMGGGRGSSGQCPSPRRHHQLQSLAWPCASTYEAHPSLHCTPLAHALFPILPLSTNTDVTMRLLSGSVLLVGLGQAAAFVPSTLAPLRSTTLQQHNGPSPLAR